MLRICFHSISARSEPLSTGPHLSPAASSIANSYHLLRGLSPEGSRRQPGHRQRKYLPQPPSPKNDSLSENLWSRKLARSGGFATDLFVLWKDADPGSPSRLPGGLFFSASPRLRGVF